MNHNTTIALITSILMIILNIIQSNEISELKLTNSILTQTITSSEAANNEPANKCFTSPTELQVR